MFQSPGDLRVEDRTEDRDEGLEAAWSVARWWGPPGPDVRVWSGGREPLEQREILF